MYTNSTTNYHLPQWIGTDKPAFLTDMNNAYATIDTQIKTANNNANESVATANNANGKADSAIASVETANTTALNATETANNATTVANNANTQAGTALTTANTAYTNATNAVNSVNGIVNGWKYYYKIASEMDVIPQINVSTVASTNRRMELFFNGKLNTLSIDIGASITDNPKLTTYLDYETLRIFPIIQLPLIAENTDRPIICSSTQVGSSNSTIGGTIISLPSIHNIAVCTYNSKLWLGIIRGQNDTSIDLALQNLGMHFSVNTNKLGTLTLDGWTDL